MQAADQVGPKILFDLSQVETGFPVRYLRYGLEGKARIRHPGIHLPKSDSGKYTIQARVSKSHPGLLLRKIRDPRVQLSALPELRCAPVGNVHKISEVFPVFLCHPKFVLAPPMRPQPCPDATPSHAHVPDMTHSQRAKDMERT